MDQFTAKTQFTSSLVRLGLCDQDHADSLASDARTRWMPLGKILVRKKKLSIKQSAAVFATQAGHPRKLFGEVAVELGFCSQDDIEDAIAFQRKECPHVLDLARRTEGFDPQDLLTAAADDVRYMERLIGQLETMTKRRSKVR